MKIRFFAASAKILGESFRKYPCHSLTAVAAIVLAGMMESFGLITLLPLIGLAMTQHGFSRIESVAPGYETLITGMLTYLHLGVTLPALLTVMSGMIIMKASLLLLAKAHVGSVTAHVAADLRMRLMNALLSASWPYFLSYPAGRFSNALSSEAGRASTSFMAGWFMVAAILQAGVLLSVAFSLSKQVFFAAFFAGLILSVCLSRTIRLARAAGLRETELMNQLVSRLTDYLQGMKPLKAMGLQSLLLPFLEKNAHDICVAQSQQSRAFAVQSVLPEPLLLVFLALGMYWALAFTNTALPVLFILAVFFNRIMGRASEAQKYYQMMVSNESAYLSLECIINEAERSNRSGSNRNNGLSVDGFSDIAFQDVSFAYKGRTVIEKMTARIPACKLTVLFGPSGSGKTTVADLIAGILEPQTGVISIGGVPYEKIDRGALRRKIGYVPQEVFLFHDTLANNISLRDSSISEEQVWEALEQAEAAGFVREMAGGIHADLGERGGRLSGGQRQRIMIARALIRKPDILILDEATTSLDLESETQLCATIRILAQAMTVIVISHQPAMKKMADHVMEIKPYEA